MSRVIIGIHGLGNKPPANLLEEWWRLSIIEGYERAGLSLPDFEFKLVYWADLLHPETLDPVQTNSKHPLFIDEPYVPADDAYLPEQAGDFRKRVMTIIGDQLENIFLKDDMTINFSSVSDFIVQRFFKDLAAYYQTYHDEVSTKDTQIRGKIRQRMAEALIDNRKNKIMIIAHSMGSIIAYDTLANVVPDINVNTLVTIGSPLGIPTIRAKIAEETHAVSNGGKKLKTPESITDQWINMADLHDKIALYYKLGDFFNANIHDVVVEDQTILNDYAFNGEKNPHKAFGYLRSKNMIEIIESFVRMTPIAFRDKLANRWDRIVRKLRANS